MSTVPNASKPHVRPLEPLDVKLLAPRLRQADVNEIQASSGLPPLEALSRSIDLSSTVMIGATDEPFCIFGCGPTPIPDLGVMWMVGTPAVQLHQRALLRECRQWIDRFHRQYRTLFNFVDERNETHIRWLRWLGVQFVARHEHHGIARIPFLEFIHV